MSLFDGIRADIQRQLRAFVLGPGVVEHGDTFWGHDGSQFQPPEYEQYIATSNSVYACASLRADLLASLPLMTFRENAKGDKEEQPKHKLNQLLHFVNPHWTMTRLIKMTELSLCIWGESFWFLERGQSGKLQPSEIWWGKADRVKVLPDKDDYVKGFVYDSITGEQLLFQPGEVVWFRFPNPIDEYEGLAPLAAARIYADYESASMKANRNLHAHGMQVGGIITPKPGVMITEDQAGQIAEGMKRRMFGAENANKWNVLRAEVDLTPMNVTPKDAEFLGGLAWSLESIARAYRVPLDLVGGQRTYENVDAAMKAIWAHTIVPEAAFIADEINEQMAPMFDNTSFVEFDDSDVAVLQEDETAKWTRAHEQLTSGVLTINEWREEQGLKPLPWGDAWWAQATLSPVEDIPVEQEPQPVPPQLVDSQAQQPQLPPPDDEPPPEPQRSHHTRAMEYGSPEHVATWQRFVRRTERDEVRFGRVVADLFRRLQDSVLDRLKQRSARAVVEELGSGELAILEPFPKATWLSRFMEGVRPILSAIIFDNGADALADIGVSLAFDVMNPEVIRFLEDRTQRFAHQVLDTTWDQLKTSLNEGVATGESIPELAARVEAVMGDRIRSSATTIARTEVIGASNGGQLLAWQQSRIVTGKQWISAMDPPRARDSHVQAHIETHQHPIPLDAMFHVGAGQGPAPGQIGLAEEDINCRCTMIAVIDETPLAK